MACLVIGDAPVLSEVVETPQSQDRTPRRAIVFAPSPAAASYRASGLVQWHFASFRCRAAIWWFSERSGRRAAFTEHDLGMLEFWDDRRRRRSKPRQSRCKRCPRVAANKQAYRNRFPPGT